MTEMEDAFNGITEHVSDKWSSYFRVYEHYFSRLKDAPIDLLEVGVQNGGSLEAWSRYFKHAKNIVGCDINPKCADLKFSDTRIKIVNGDINEGQTKSAIQAISAQYDVIIDDGSHNSPDIIQAGALSYQSAKACLAPRPSSNSR
jgi:23S rRNA U2552 (ribose-2'-O)-methylase RlmE/FtsJ